MPKISILNLYGETVETPSEQTSVLALMQEKNIDWMHACGGKGRCTTCAFRVVKGPDAFSAPSHVELTFREQGRLPEGYRLACQSRCTGVAEIEVPTPNQLPHMKYGYE